MRRSVGVVLALLVVSSPSARAEHSQPRGSHERVLDTTHPFGERALREAARSMTLARSPAQQAPRRRHWAARHPVLLGTMVGGGVGLGAVAAQGCNSSDYTCAGLVAFFGGTGAALGAAGGAIASIFLR